MSAPETATALVAADVDPNWMTVYVERNHVANDPVLWQGMYSNDPFFWDLKFRHPALPDSNQKRVLEDAEAFGIRSGLVWPIHEPGFGFGLVSCFAQGDGHRVQEVLADEGIALLTMLIQRLYQRSVTLREHLCPRPQPQPLSEREKEVLFWAALGKSTWEIARILKITERTIRFHMSNAETKLGVDNRSEAIDWYIRWEWGANTLPAPYQVAP